MSVGTRNLKNMGTTNRAGDGAGSPNQSHRPHESQATDLLVDPQDPRSTYLLEPDDVAHLVARVVATDGQAQTSTSPFSGAPLASIPRSSRQDVTEAVSRARHAQGAWERTPARKRARIMLALHDIVLTEQTEILDLIQLESGKSRASAYEEIADVAQVTRHYGVRGPAYLKSRSVRGMLPLLTSTRVERHAVGVVGVISPWNYPLTLALADVLPALVAGNAVVLKPDEQTTLTALWAADALARAGLPDGLLQIVVGGADIGSALVDQADHIAFTGSTAVGRVIANQAADRLIGVTLELGGKNPLYVAADADVESAAEGAVRACFSNSGQLCMSIERLILHEDIAEEFLGFFLPRVKSLRLGADLDYRADIGSLTTQEQLDRVIEHVDDAIARGARVLAGGVQRSDVGPLFYAPTVLKDLPAEALCVREETFGPVVAVTEVADDTEAIRAMNDSAYGLNASIWTSDSRKGRKLARQVKAGTVNINDGYAAAWGSIAAPMGGFKDSGHGRRHGREIIEAVTEAQTVSVQRGVGHGASLDALFSLPDGQGQKVLTKGLRLLRALRFQ